MVTVPVILAGGIGERFWPISRSSSPKQLLKLISSKTMLEETIDRVAPLCKNGVKPLIITGTKIAGQMKKLLPKTLDYDCIAEPEGKNTAPAILLAAAWIEKKYGSSVMVILSADHSIKPKTAFRSAVRTAVSYAAAKNALVIFGIKPSRPETGYGYIQVKRKKEFNDLDNLYKVKTFTEKPNEEMAKIFIDSGEFYWNSGIFISSLSTMLESLQQHLTEIALKFEHGRSKMNTSSEEPFIRKTYSECQAISIDYGIMEKAKNVYVLTADFGWSDLGTWSSLYENKEKDGDGNVIRADNVMLYDTENCIVDISKNKMAVIQGLDGFIIAERNDTLMICRREDEDQVKKFVTDVRIQKGDSLV